MSWIFAIVVQPWIHILELFYSVFYKMTENAGISVIGLSFVVTFLTLPLYMVAEKWQETERQTQAKLKPWVEKIKATFSGDEQYMILSNYYRINHYHPLMALRSSFSLLIQIPFFIAAYSFLSNLESLKGVSFFFIKDFGVPDATFYIGSFPVNILPIAMTIINCVSGAIYSKGHSISEKIQIYGCALIFLLLLYMSPAGLVVYWTMNNILSLVKNIFYKIKNPKKSLYIILCVISVFMIIFPFTPIRTSIKIINQAIIALGLVLPALPFVVKFFARLIEKNFSLLEKDTKLRSRIFFCAAIVLALLAGLCIPSMIVSSESVNYSYVDSEKVSNNPLAFVFYTMCIAIGAFLFWPGCFYGLFSQKVKKGLAVIFPLLAIGALINTFLFSGEYGALLPECLFMFDVTIDVSKKEILIHLLLMLFVFALLIFLLLKFPKVVQFSSCIFLLALSVVVIKNVSEINSDFKKMMPPTVQEKIEPVYHLSKTGKNVIVIMQDRLFSPYVNDALKEFPELQNQFEGFKYYPKTLSNGWLTMLGCPELFGGYDFTPFEVNKRTDETLQQKHNKALLTMPVIFNNAGFNTTVSNLPYENFFEYPIDKMYEDYQFVNRANTKGVYTDLWYKQNNYPKSHLLAKSIKRNMIWFSVFKMCPPIARDMIYYNEYWNSELHSSDRTFIRFIDNYSELDYLPEMTDFSSEKNSFIIIDNEMTHDPALLQYPDYVPAVEVTEFGKSKYAMSDSYCSTVAALKRYAEFFAYLKENDVYDNTRIIVVSDHGAPLANDDIDENVSGIEMKYFVATLLVKDFDARGVLQKDFTLMLNADTPYLATKDIVLETEAKNPFTGTSLKVEDKARYIVFANALPEGTRSRHKTKFDIKDNEWFFPTLENIDNSLRFD